MFQVWPCARTVGECAARYRAVAIRACAPAGVLAPFGTKKHMRIFSIVLSTVMAAPWLCGQSMDPATRELIQTLVARIDGLEKRVSELEQKKKAAAPVVPVKAVASALPQSAPAAHDHDQAPAAAAATDVEQPSCPPSRFRALGTSISLLRMRILPGASPSKR